MSEKTLTDIILDRLDKIEERQEVIRTENREDHDKIFGKIDAISIGGCAVGKANADAIIELKHRPEKALNIAAAIISTAAMLTTLWTFFHMVAK